MLGYDGTESVTIDEMIHHTKAVMRGAKNTFVAMDMPFGSYEISTEKAVENAVRMYKEAKPDCLKLEGGIEVVDQIHAITKAGIPVMAHIGLTPQSASILGGLKVQGGSTEGAQKLLEDAKAVQEAGAFSVVIEAVPKGVAKKITETLEIPVLGIGAGPHVDCQVLVFHDLLGLFGDFKPKFVKQFANLREEMIAGLNNFRSETISGEFPSEEYSFNKEVEGFEAE